MQKNNLILTAILVFVLSLVGIYAFAQQHNPGHTWNQMDCDTKMCVGNNVGIGTTAPEAKLDVQGQIKISDGSNKHGTLQVGCNGTNCYAVYAP
jgi:hypothetical protein